MQPTRSWPRMPAVIAATMALALALAACGSSGSSGAGGSGTTSAGDKAKLAEVHLAYSADMQVPDPDIFYELEGNSLTTSVYEGLVRYKPDSTEIEGALAESWTVSPDGLTYTFKLRDGVTFHDGTKLDAAAVKGSFERRTKVGSAPAYMLADVKSYDTPDPLTFVVHLGQPVSSFMDYLAAPYGPKAVSPKVLSEHTVKDDSAQEYLKTHDAGTGPFTITGFELGVRYTLTRYDAYWGGKPDVAKITMDIIPDISTQRLKLESGDLSMIIHGLSTDDIASLEGKGFQVKRFPAFFKAWIMVNENKGIFKDKALRLALAGAIDKKTLTEQVFGDNAKVSTQFYPSGELPEGQAADTATFDPSKLADAVKGLSSKKVDVGFSSDDPRNGRLAELVQTELQAAGLDATVRGIPIAQVFDLPNHKDQAPDLLLSTVNPDAASPETWARIFANTDGALNWEQCSVPAADAKMDEGLHATTDAAVKAAYAEAGTDLIADGCYITIADVKEVIVADKGYSNFVHQLPTVFTIRFGDLKTG
ncbi:MAG: peptide/nickel transport system substrate-binding protein [Actinomycetota bacterium]|nr:peptide/nickel transport system substrate-binding protein [Actinomycetota bacterium]